MACIAFFVGLVLFLRRRRTGEPRAVPIAVMVLGLVRAALFVATIGLLIATFRSLANVPAEDKATILAAGISEAMNTAWLGWWLDPALLLGAFFLDVRVRDRQKHGPAAPAPAGARCTQHDTEPATHVCARCGTFMCARCTALDGSLCAACIARVEITSPPAR